MKEVVHCAFSNTQKDTISYTVKKLSDQHDLNVVHYSAKNELDEEDQQDDVDISSFVEF